MNILYVYIFCIQGIDNIVRSSQVTLPELSRARRQFISYSKGHPPAGGAAEVATCFVTYLNTTLT